MQVLVLFAFSLFLFISALSWEYCCLQRLGLCALSLLEGYCAFTIHLSWKKGWHSAREKPCLYPNLLLEGSYVFLWLRDWWDLTSALLRNRGIWRLGSGWLPYSERPRLFFNELWVKIPAPLQERLSSSLGVTWRPCRMAPPLPLQRAPRPSWYLQRGTTG